MQKKKTVSKKHVSKSIAKVLTLTMAASTVVTILPASYTKAEVSQDTSVTDVVSVPNTNESNAVDAPSNDPVNEVPSVTPPVDEPSEVIPTPEIDQPSVEIPVPEEVVQPVVQPVVQALDTARSAQSVSDLQTALVAVELALNLTTYNALSPEDQAAVAQALLSGNSNEIFTDSALIQEALNKAVAAQRDIAAQRDAIAAVNTAGSASELQSALEAPYLGLVMLNYRKLAAEVKLEVAEAVLQAVPAGGFANRTDIQEVFNAAIASVVQA